ncbi:MAG: protein tyrosine phosphatase family protein [Ramlibacter sp.]
MPREIFRTTDAPNPPAGGVTVESIPSYVRLTDSLATAGQPSEAQLAALATAGFEVVINLGLHGDPNYSLPDEAATVRGLGLEYVHLPVQFGSPQMDTLAAFSGAMERAGSRKVLVHCRHNKRVPVFIALDRILRQGWSEEAALGAMRDMWQPDEAWTKFIARALERSL